MTNQTESKSTSLPPHARHLIHLSQSLEDALGPIAPDPTAPEFAAYLNNQILLQQTALLEHLHILIETDSFDYRAITNLRQTLALIEKTQARQERKKVKELAPDQPERDEARNFLQAELAQGERPASELLKLARSIGIASATLRRAKSSLNVNSNLRYHPNQPRCWMWSMPEKDPAHAVSEASTSTPNVQDTPTTALAPSASAVSEDREPSKIENDTLSPDTAKPIGPVRPTEPIEPDPVQPSNHAQDSGIPQLSARKT